MSNALMGEYPITLNGIDYKLTMNMNAIASYESETHRDFMADAYKAINAMVMAGLHRDTPSKYAQILCEAVSREQAATLVYIAAKESNSQVEFEEIQEAFLLDHDLTDSRFHPAIFTTLVLFAINGKNSKDKKKGSSKLG